MTDEESPQNKMKGKNNANQKKGNLKIANENESPQKKKAQFNLSQETNIFSDDEEDVKKKKMNKASRKRFGYNIKFENYKTSNLIKIICITLAIIIIPLEIFVQNVLQTAEGQLIIDIQRAFGYNDSLQTFLSFPLILVRPECTCVFMFMLYLSTDSLIAFKSSIMTCFGIYLITFLKLLYKDGRPFWINADIIGYECMFDFAGPAYHLYMITFFWLYNIIMYCMKYSENVNKPLVIILFSALGLIGVWIIIGGLYNGTIYIYQNVIGCLYGVIFLVLCMNFDTEIHRMCEKTGFIVQSSRKYKFYLFFLCIGLFVMAMIYYNCELDQWTMPQTWVVNASEPSHMCKQKLLETSNNRLGLDQTFFYTSILFFITGMGFGTSYSLVHVDCIDWVHTSLIKRIVRGLLGCGISIGTFYLYRLIPTNDDPTKYFFHFALPSLHLSFFVYGIFPIICLKIGLVDKSEDNQNWGETQQDPKKQSKRESLLDSESEEEEEELQLNINKTKNDNSNDQKIQSSGK